MLIYALDLRWLGLLAPAVALLIWARRRSAAARTSGPVDGGPTGRDLAAAILPAGTPIVVARGPTADLYERFGPSLRLSAEVAGGIRDAALGVAAHEASHALRPARGPFRVREVFILAAALGADVAWLVIAAGIGLGDYELLLAGLRALWLALALSLADLPAERVASRAAIAALKPIEGLAAAIDAAAWLRLADLGPPGTRGRRSWGDQPKMGS